MEKMVVGFAFTENRRSVVLIRKNRPEWMAGKLNGVGGHIEKGETPVGAMVREFEEETGVLIVGKRWTKVVEIQGKDWHVTFFYTELIGLDLHMITSETDEEVVRVSCFKDSNAPKMIPNLDWLIPFCLNSSDLQLPIKVKDFG